jgi:outer membrane protein assembly factor BamB/ubiquinone/menaquinone biosynthesis C-methylase UbiE
MKTKCGFEKECVFILSAICVLPVAMAQQADYDTQAKQILNAANVTGGVVIHIGCGDGKLTAALRAGENCLVQGLDTDAQEVQKAREYISKLGCYGPVSVELFDGRNLPYVDNLVNLVVAEDLGNVPTAETMRILAPGGALYTKQKGRWTTIVKPRPKEIDEWTHYLHDASGNAVAHDEVVGPPRHIQWIADPRHTRSHEHIPSIYALVSTGGRIFYIADEAAIGSIRQTPQWYLEARDAFNGTQLWKRSIDTWFPHIVNWGQTPPQLERKLVAVGNRVYVTLGLYAPLSALDAATGETLKVYENTEGAEEIILHKGTLLVVVRSVTAERLAKSKEWARLVQIKDSPVYVRETAEPLVKQLRATEAKGEKTLLALDAQTGRLLWKKSEADVAGLRTSSLCAEENRVFYQNGKDIVCLDFETGAEQWSVPGGPLHMVYDGSLYYCDGPTVTALAAETGKTRWTQPALLTEVRDVFVAGGSLWVGGFKPFPAKRGPSWGPYFATQCDLATGKVLMHVEPENPGHHHRCYSNKATDRYILGGRRGTEFIDLTSGDVLWNSWARGVCRYGVMPSNGLLYTPPHACGCYVGVKLTGFHALAPQRKTPEVRGQKSEGLEKGPAFVSLKSEIRDSRPPASGGVDWPTYRHDAQRSGRTQVSVPAGLRRAWRAELGGKLTAPTVAEDKVFVASVDEHRITAMDADAGKVAWNFTGGARIDSPPSIYQGRVFFGCRDGYVYSVRASDGQLAWRRQAAREERCIAACGQLESASPVIGSVLVDDGVVYATAGRSSYADGGIDLYRLKSETGSVLSRTTIYSPDPETGKQPDHIAPAVMPGARADILTADDSCVYLRDMAFDKSGTARPEGKAHLFTLTDFLDDTWPHRSYWIFGTQCSLATGCSSRDKNLIFGRMLVFDESKIYGYGRSQVHWSNQLQDGPYRLFSIGRDGGPALWQKPLKIQVRSMILTDNVLFVAGPALDVEGETGNKKAVLMAISASDGTELAKYELDCPPIFDGMAAAYGRLYVSMTDGSLVCMAQE